MNKIVLISLFILSINNIHAQRPVAEDAVIFFREKHFVPENSWGFYAATSKKTIISHNASVQLEPASLIKLITTGVALTEIDSSFRYETTLEYDGIISGDTLFGNLYIKGSGDPSFGSSLFDSTKPEYVFTTFLSALKKK